MFRFRQVKQQFKVILLQIKCIVFDTHFFVFVNTNYLPTLLYFCTRSKYGLFTFNQQLSFCGPEAMVSSLQRNRHTFFIPLLCAPPLRKQQFWLFVNWISHLGNYKQLKKTVSLRYLKQEMKWMTSVRQFSLPSFMRLIILNRFFELMLLLCLSFVCILNSTITMWNYCAIVTRTL